MKRVLSILILLLIGQIGYSQADCVLTFKISGKVTANGTKPEKIYLPSTVFLVGYEKFDSKTGFYYLDLKSESFSEEFRSHLSSDFCMDAELIVERVFKKVKNYPIRIAEKVKDQAGDFKYYELEIPTEQIKFILNNEERIEIILPNIKL